MEFNDANFEVRNVFVTKRKRWLFLNIYKSIL